MSRTRTWVGVALLVAGLSFAAAGRDARAMTVLDIPPGVGRIGAGGAGVAAVSGAETIYYNPAGLAALPGISFSSFYASHFGAANLTAFSLALRGFAVAAELYSAGGIDGYDAGGNPTGDIAYSSSAYMFGFGVDPTVFPFLPRLPIAFSVGGLLKGVSSSIGEVSGSGFAFDLGFRMDIPPLALGPLAVSDAALGVTFGNLFGSMSYDGTRESFAMDIGLGLTARFAGVLILATDVHLAGSSCIGITYVPIPSLALRLGVLSKGQFSVTAGVGLNVSGFLIDYALLTHTVGPTHRIGLSLDFSELDLSAFGSMLRRVLP
jgi:hypothetical protein